MIAKALYRLDVEEVKIDRGLPKKRDKMMMELADLNINYPFNAFICVSELPHAPMASDEPIQKSLDGITLG
jgi:hypothetical protein